MVSAPFGPYHIWSNLGCQYFCTTCSSHDQIWSDAHACLTVSGMCTQEVCEVFVCTYVAVPTQAV